VVRYKLVNELKVTYYEIELYQISKLLLSFERIFINWGLNHKPFFFFFKGQEKQEKKR